MFTKLSLLHLSAKTDGICTHLAKPIGILEAKPIGIDAPLSRPTISCQKGCRYVSGSQANKAEHT